jgi:hypothetical protein
MSGFELGPFDFGDFGSSVIGGDGLGSKIGEAVAGGVITILGAILIGSLAGNVFQANDNKRLLQQVEQLRLIFKHQKAEVEELKKKYQALKFWAFKKRKELEMKIAAKSSEVLNLALFLERAEQGKITTVEDRLSLLKIVDPIAYAEMKADLAAFEVDL